ncbi:MAG: UDP-2,3-diacylglucosamine diphosphatase LpxI [Candidatus Omnitrophota bacterium]
MERLGLIAGNGQFPLVLARQARRKGYFIACCAVRGETDPALEAAVDAFVWAEVWELEKLLHFFKSQGIRRAIMAGQVRKERLFKESSIRAHLPSHIADRALLGILVKSLKDIGVCLLDSTQFLAEDLARKGSLSRRSPTPQEWKDIAFGTKVAKRVASFEIGQTVVVKHGVVLAIEALEGTDQAIRRGGALGEAGAVVVKVARPRQDMRFDVPVVGPTTVEVLKAIHASVLAVQAGKTLFIEKEQLLASADEAGLAVVGIR